MSEISEKKDGLQLLAALTNDNTKAVFVRSFESHLTDLVMELLSPDLTDSEALARRAQAIGVITVLNRIGAQMVNAEGAAVRRATQRRVLQAIGDDLG